MTPHASSPGRDRLGPASFRGPILTLLLLVVIELTERDLLRLPNPDAIYVTMVVYSAFSGGIGAGLLSAAITLAYSLYFYATPGSVFVFPAENAHRMVVLAITTPALAIMVGFLKRSLALQLAATRESEARTRAVIDGMADGVLTFDPAGRIEWFTPGAARVFGWPADAALRQNVSALVPGILEGGKTPGWIKTRGRRHDGSWFPLELSVTEVDVRGQVQRIAIARDVTERNEAERALAEQAARLEDQAQLLDLAHDTIMVRNRGNLITFWNRGAVEMYGYTSEEAIGKDSHTFLKTIFPVALDQIEAMLVATGRWEGELVHSRKDGTRIVVASRWALQRDAAGAPLATLEINNDITQRKRAIEERERQSERLKDQAELLDLAHDTIMVRDMASAITFWNHGAEEMYGWRRDEAIGQNSHAFLKTIFPAPLPDIEKQLLSEGRWEGELVHARRDGTRVVVASRWALQRNAIGSPVAILEINNDITERKRVQAALDRARRQSELILESAGDGIYGIDRDGNATFVNPAAAKMLGHEARALIGRDMHELHHHTRPDGSTHPKEACPVLQTLLDGHVRQVTDDIFVRRDGSTIPVEYVSTPIREAGTIVGAVVAFRDVTERREVERMKDEFVSVVSHELRTPLTSIRGALGLLASGDLGSLPEKGSRMMTVASDSAERLARLVDDILDVQRMDSGHITLSRRPCDAIALLRQSADMMAPVAERAGIAIRVPDGALPVNADPDRLLQTVTNLLGNAIKFSPSGSEVGLGAERRDGSIRFTVTDHGRGIPADKLTKVFDRFEQVDASDSREKGGTGLGLTIAKRIVELHGGRIWAESA
ncbi:MAG: PAS domain S-box protein, partial [Acidobacteriota bacterium]